MSEKIKVEIELIPVWCGFTDESSWLERWATEEMVKRSEAYEHNHHSVSDGIKIISNKVSQWNQHNHKYTTTDPHQPKQPEWMPSGEYELWEYIDGLFDSDDGGHNCFSSIMDDHLDRFHSFAVQAGDGTVHLMNSPVWYAREGYSSIFTEWVDGVFQAQILGCVMRKAGE